MNILLLTATISPDISLHTTIKYPHNTNPNTRLKWYIESIIYYITKSDFDHIIFCENSWYDLWSIDFINQIACIYNKHFEFLSMQQNQEIINKLWYAYWEAELMDFAINNSTILNSQKHINFWKITWRYICKNINDMIRVYKSQDQIFFKSFGFGFSPFSISTAIFKASTKFYKDNLLNIWIQCNTNKWIWLENVYYKILRELYYDSPNSIKNAILPKIYWWGILTDAKNQIIKLMWFWIFWYISKITDMICFQKMHWWRYNK